MTLLFYEYMLFCIKTQVQFSRLYYVKFFLFSWKKNLHFNTEHNSERWWVMPSYVWNILCSMSAFDPIRYLILSESICFCHLSEKMNLFFHSFALYLCSSSAGGFVKLPLWIPKSSVCYAYMIRERRALYSTAAKVTPTFRIDQKTVLWVKYLTASRTDNEDQRRPLRRDEYRRA